VSDFIPSYAVPLAGFNSCKAAQVCAFFATKSEGQIDKLKLIKLVYLSERHFLSQYHLPMLFDELYSLPHGPICSSTLNGIDCVIDRDEWSRYIQMHGNRAVSVKSFSDEELDELSEAEIECLSATWSEFGHKTASQLRNWTHLHCPEYTEITRGRVPISYADVLKALDDKDAELVDREIRDLRIAESMLT
jgi:uncharacterized phage-associated protein